MSVLIRSASVAVLILATLGAAQCRKPAAPEDPGFVQTVRIDPVEPHQGDQIRIWSEVTNAGPRPRWGTFTYCALGLAGDLALSEIPGTVRCASPSFDREIAPGESIEAGDAMVVDSPAGTYVLEVRQLINPRIVYRVSVRVLD